ncbi:MAG: serine hydrolase domain-containing protein [Candidatus Acidiferrum sp.]
MRIVLTAGLIIVLLAVAGMQVARPSPDSMLASQIDSIFSGVVQPDTPGAAVLVKRDGTILFEKAYGVRELRTRTKIDPQTNFRLASFTKQFTAMAIMLLVHDGKLHYDHRLTDIFLDFPAYGKPITIRHLLNHTAGLPDYEDLMEKEEKARGPIWSAKHQIQDAEVLSLLEKQTSGEFAPGTSWAYSNSGYVVLGLIVAKASGMPYRDFLQKRIFAPAAMNHSIVYQKGINNITERAFGHSKENGGLVETDQSSTSATLGDGGVYSNLADLAKWDDALQKHTLLSEKEMAPAFTPVRLSDGSEPHWPAQPDGDNLAPGKPVSYGFGWFLDPYEGRARTWHTGSTMGFRTVIQRFAADGLTIVILCNRTDLDPKSLAESIANLALRPAAH